MFVIELRPRYPNEPCWYVSTMKGISFEFFTVSNTVDNAREFASEREAYDWMWMNAPRWVTENYDWAVMAA